ncbi:MAG: hypothetical protein JWN02_2667 [Acidobacteria bacterium]|nr:hypothetical protein [Acidobacteriota bacterium]
MNRTARFASAALALTLSAAPLFAKSDAMSLIPGDAVSVGVVHLAELRQSPLSSTLFQQTDKISTQGDAEKFLTDAGLQPSKDVDLLVVSTSPKTALGSEADILVAAEGRFNIDRLTKALVERGAVKKGAYYVLPEKNDKGQTAAVAFPDEHLALMGTEGAVSEALATRSQGGGGTFMSASGLGRDAARIDAHASAWAIFDVARVTRLTGVPHVGSSAQGQALSSAIKNVSTVAIWATDAGDSLKLGGFGLTGDAETLGLLEDTLRGALAAMRLAVQDKSPELVSVLRKFTVTRTNDSVAISGSIAGDTLRNFAAKKSASK